MKRHAPAAARNRDPIIAILRDELPEAGSVLEIASGTGEHAIAFARAFPRLTWQPSDQDAGALRSIDAWAAEADLPNLLNAVVLDAAADMWPVTEAGAIVCINMVHISPWRATVGLMRGAARRLRPGSPLILYGPYLRDSIPTAPSNEAFDASLKARNPEWGLRPLEQVALEAGANGLRLSRLAEMPANNLTLVFRRD